MHPREKAQQGLSFLKEAVLDVIAQHPDGISNARIADVLQIRSDYEGVQKDYLSWSVLGLLLNEKKITKKGARATARYFVSHP